MLHSTNRFIFFLSSLFKSVLHFPPLIEKRHLSLFTMMLQHVCDSLGVGENNVPTVIQIKRCRICLPDTRGEKLCCRKCLLPATVQEINLSSLVSFCSEGDALFFSSSFFPSACLGKKKKSVFARRYHTCHQFSKIIRQSNVP